MRNYGLYGIFLNSANTAYKIAQGLSKLNSSIEIAIAQEEMIKKITDLRTLYKDFQERYSALLNGKDSNFKNLMDFRELG